MMQHNSFGSRLRWWRKRCGLSQLDLAGAAGTSQRHVSFLESGRTHAEPFSGVAREVSKDRKAPIFVHHTGLTA
jgi:transcriptional regulator with XRE-family HTH domain